MRGLKKCPSYILYIPLEPFLILQLCFMYKDVSGCGRNVVSECLGHLYGDLCPVLRMMNRRGQSSSSLAFVKPAH